MIKNISTHLFYRCGKRDFS
uniref:Uncharacterized protein n=1 Tax=Rhizophora mucronata TaxID=61149 RepID=A0A2P2QR97_RHIMU